MSIILGRDTNPKKQVYYLAALILKELNNIESKDFDLIEIYNILKSQENISFNLYSLALDWLFLLGAIKKEKNRLIKCF